MMHPSVIGHEPLSARMWTLWCSIRFSKSEVIIWHLPASLNEPEYPQMVVLDLGGEGAARVAQSQ